MRKSEKEVLMDIYDKIQVQLERLADVAFDNNERMEEAKKKYNDKFVKPYRATLKYEETDKGSDRVDEAKALENLVTHFDYGQQLLHKMVDEDVMICSAYNM